MAYFGSQHFKYTAKPTKSTYQDFYALSATKIMLLPQNSRPGTKQTVKTASQMSPSNIARIINVSHNFNYMHQFFALQISRNSKFYFYFLRKEQRTLVAID